MVLEPVTLQLSLTLRVVILTRPIASLVISRWSILDLIIQEQLRFWIADPQEGVNNIRSDVNRAIWRLFKENGITIPVAQQEVKFQMKRPGDDLL